MTDQTLVVGLAGASGSGKTMVAQTIVDELGTEAVQLISEDQYYHPHEHEPFEIREKQNFDHPDAFDHELLIEHISQLRNGHSVYTPEYDYVNHTRMTTRIAADPKPILLVEGILVFNEPVLRDLFNIKIFVDTPLDICLIRRFQRDIEERGRTIESVIRQYRETVRPSYFHFIEPTKRYADVIIPRGGKNRIAIDLIKSRLQQQVNRNA